ncbi:MAG: asparagine synthase-related protein [Geobacteraceae bacterium]|nr:asparagine synthase-related protein [Geobacteraceae bacterium]
MFFFYFNRKNASSPRGIDPDAVINRLMPCAPPDKSGFLDDEDTSLLVQCLHWNTSRSRLEPAPLYHAESRCAAASWARLDNRDELAKKLDIAPADLAGMCDTELILLCYLKWQEACVDHLIGDFVFVIHDRQRNTVFCGRDHMGVRPFYYFASDDLFVCATNVSALRLVDGVPFEIDERWVAEYLLQLSMSFDRTPYLGIMKLPPAHCLTVTPHQLRLRQYFELSAEPALKLKDSRDYVAAYREQLEEAIACRLDSEYAIGCELSGGIDSSTITAFAARLMKQPLSHLHTFGFAFSELEPQYIMAVSRECRLANNHIFAGAEGNQLATMQRSLDLLGYPMEHGNGPFHEPFYQLAEKLEVRTMLSGFGGDEFGTTIHGYMVPMEMLLQRRYGELFDILAGNPLFRLLRLIKLEWRRRKTANFTASSHNPDFFQAFQQRWPHHIIRPELVHRYGLEERYFNEARFDAGYTDLKRFTLEKRWLPFVPTRMENCTLMAAGRKVDYRWPLLDIRLVRLFLAIPSEENFYRGMGRYLHRRAIDGVVPDLVTWKPGKDMGAFMGPAQGDTDQLLQLDPSKLHPALTKHLDTDKLRRQAEQLTASLTAPPGDNKRFQHTRNIRAVKQLDTWLKTVSTDYTD